MRSTHTLGVGVAVLTALLFATANVYHRRATRHVRGTDATVLTLTINLAMFLPIGIIYWSTTGDLKFDPVAIALYLAVGLFALALGRLGMYNTIMLVGPSRASAIKNSSPIFTLILAFVVLRSVPSPVSLVGVALIVAGVWVYGAERGRLEGAPPPAAPGELGTVSGPLGGLPMRTAGIILGIGVAFAYAAADVFRALALDRQPDVLTATVWVSLTGWVLVVAPLAATGDLRASFAGSIGPGRRDLVKAGVLMGLGQLTNFVAVALLFVGYVTALIAMAPLFTAIVSRRMERHDEVFGRPFWIATALLVPGAAIINFAG